MLRPLRLLAGAALALALFAPGAVVQAAEPFTFLVNGHGTLSFAPCTSPAPTCAVGTANGVANDWAGMPSPIPGTWEVQFIRNLDLAAMTHTGTFAFIDTGASGNSLYGSVSGSWVVITPGYTRGRNLFTIEGGTGIFNGATGSGENTTYSASVLGQYVDAGIFNVTLVPEPSTALLLTVGAMALTVMRRRQRR